MTESHADSPEHVLDLDDPGSDVQRRFRYQAAYAATLAVDMLDDVSDSDRVFCEHHEDILIRLTTGDFRAVQVKTRDQPDPFKSDDDPVASSIARFVRLDTEFPQRFVDFQFATNHAFFTARKNGKNLPHLLSLAKATEDGALPEAALRAYLGKIAKAAFDTKSPTGSECDAVLNVLQRTQLNCDLPKLDNIELVLAGRIGEVDARFGDVNFVELRQAARTLVDETLRASSMYDRATNYGYAFLATRLESSDEAEATKSIKQKTLTADFVTSVIARALSDLAPLVSGKPIDPSSIPDDLGVMERKLVAGGLSVTTVRSAYDCLASAQALGMRLLYRYGEERGSAKYTELRTTVHRECSGAFEESFREGEQFGRSMFVNLEKRLAARTGNATGNVAGVGCKTEHLLGHAYSLTNDCEVWWSDAFEIEDD